MTTTKPVFVVRRSHLFPFRLINCLPAMPVVERTIERLFVSRAFLILVCAAGCFFTSEMLLAFFSREAPTKPSNRALTFEERVSYQWAIEEVYWRHRIWPKDSPNPKPSLDTVMPRTQLEKKVEDYLRNSLALEDYWQAPITAEQLQAELNRMAKYSKQADVLRELFDALGNDPFIIAECLARPALTERVLTSRYAFDQRIHGQLRRRAEFDLLAHPGVEQMKQTSGAYSEIDLVRSNASQDEHLRGTEYWTKLDDRQWDETVRTLAAAFNKPTAPRISAPEIGQPLPLFQGANVSAHPKNGAAEDYGSIPVGQLSSLREDDARYYATAVIEKAEGHLKVATVSWSKEPLETWRVRVEQQSPAAISAPSAAYTFPAISDGTSGCFDGAAWASTSLNTPVGRERPPAVWTGSEMIIWGGYGGLSLNTGGRYNPSTDTWTTISTTNAPTPRAFHTLVWTGSEMIVWGGGYYDGLGIIPVDTGGRYNPATDSWKATNTTNAPTARAVHTAVWTGNKMIVWGGATGDFENYVNTGGRYDVTTDTWTSTSTANAPQARHYHTAVWTGNEMIVWGGYAFVNGIGILFDTGGKYSPITDTWVPTSTNNAPAGRLLHTAVWTGTEMIVWGGRADPSFVAPSNTGGRYNPSTNSWTTVTLTNAPVSREFHTAVWTGKAMIVWGGWNENVTFLDSGGIYKPDTNSWIATSTVNAPAARSKHTAIWTGSEMLVWGGTGNDTNQWLSRGGRYNPTTDTWITDTTPSGRVFHTAVWTGSEMIVWGGFDINYAVDPDGNTATGGRYTPSTDSWTATTIINAPSARTSHTAVWSGREMIIWGGFDAFSGALKTGGRYNPSTNSWTVTNAANAPVGRSSATAVWTGTEMIVWGGGDDSGTLFNTGGRYNPNMDSWTATSTVKAPTARAGHKAVWTGTEMIIWGGATDAPYFLNPLNTGGKYSAATDTWTSTATDNAPLGRTSPTAVWTGSEMIIWGGVNGGLPESGELNTGGRYNPATDSWKPTNLINAPSARAAHTAVWTGSKMIIWGGTADVAPYWFNTGGRYDPVTDLWSATRTTNNAPPGRSGHTAVWTGSEMIVWGGLGQLSGLSIGGRYCPQSDPSSTPTSYMISVRESPSGLFGGGFVDGGGMFAPGASVTVTATPYSCYTFANWTESGVVVSGSPTYQFSAHWDRLLVAHFSRISYKITAIAGIGGTASGGGSYGCDASVTVIASPSPGYQFVSWSENGSIVSTSPQYSFIASADRTLVADFVAGAPLVVATPRISPKGGSFEKKVNVKLSCATAGATIYYTLNGNDPTTASAIYSRKKKFKGIKLKGKGLHTVKAMAAASGFNNSTIASATFTIN